MVKVVLTVLFSALSISCETAGDMKGGSAESDVQHDGRAVAPVPVTVNIPDNIAGTFLACVKTDLPSGYQNSVPSSAIGCSFYDDENRNRIPAENLGKKIEWSYDFVKPVTGKVTIFEPEEANNQGTPDETQLNIASDEVYFIFEGEQPSLDENLQNFRISFIVEDFSGQRIRYQNTNFLNDSSLIDPKEQVTQNNSNAPLELGSFELSSLRVIGSSQNGVIRMKSNPRLLGSGRAILVDSHQEANVYLACFLTVSPNNFDKAQSFAAIGCAFYDLSTEKRVLLESFAGDVFWRAPADGQSNYKGRYIPENESMLFDVYFIFDNPPGRVQDDFLLFSFEYEINLL